MDWKQIGYTAESSIVGLLVIAATSILCVWQAKADRRLALLLPMIAAILVVAICSLLSGLPNFHTTVWAFLVPSTGFLIVAILIVPAVLALRRRWLGILHVATLAAVVALWFTTCMLLVRDAP